MGKSKDLAVLILAAGTSSRLGEPKQLVCFQNKTLLENACLKALEFSKNVFVVLGSDIQKCKEEIKHLDVNIIENKNYKEGLSSSIKEGIFKLQNYERVLIMLCDQPLIPLSHFKDLVLKSNKENEIICSFYKDDVAVPTIFPNRYFEELLSLSADKGAKAIIKKNDYLSVLLDDKLAFDVDTKEDKESLIKK